LLLPKNIKIEIQKNVIFPLVLYGCKGLPLILLGENKLKALGNRVLRRTFEPKRDKIIGSWRRLHNAELHELYSLPNIIRMVQSRSKR
jgi:hypothetical protein